MFCFARWLGTQGGLDMETLSRDFVDPQVRNRWVNLENYRGLRIRRLFSLGEKQGLQRNQHSTNRMNTQGLSSREVLPPGKPVAASVGEQSWVCSPTLAATFAQLPLLFLLLFVGLHAGHLRPDVPFVGQFFHELGMPAREVMSFCPVLGEII